MRCIKCRRTIQGDSSFCKYCGSPQPERSDSQKKPKNHCAPNGTGYVYKRGSTYTIRFRKYAGVAPNGSSLGVVERTKGGFHTRADALAYLSNLKSPSKSTTNLSVAYYWQSYQPKLNKLSRSRQIGYVTAYNRLKPIYATSVSELTVADLRNVVSNATDSYYPANDMKTVLQRIFDLAAADNPSINQNLPSFIELPQRNEKQQDAFTPEEISSIYQSYLDGHSFCGYILLMIYTSMMPGELIGLQKSSIDLSQHKIIGAGIKTETRKETPIVFPAWLSPVLQNLVSLHPAPSLMPKGITKNGFYQRYYDALKIAGCRRLTPYACRHTTQTLLALDPTISPAERAAVMRHSIRMEDRYTHIQDRFASNAVSKLQLPAQDTTLPDAE